ncbi:MAG: OmpA family protein [Treponemataceae bacterium]|nr:OmpA family protein [Treponemataceae bacterium]
MNIKKSLFIILTLSILLVQGLFAKETVYISPNNDGVQDELEIPLLIKDKRYISEWNLIITDESGKVVKTIGNKVRQDESASGFFHGLVSGNGAKDFFKNLGNSFAPKKGVDVPEKVRWNGVMDDGKVAPDGKYYYYLTASDDNGNTAQTKKYEVVVDNTPPSISLTQPSESAKIFGAGSKPSITFKQTGSKEDLWKAFVSDSNGNVVRNYVWEESAPLTIDWDGKDDEGLAVGEGVYSYSITSTDRAGNVSSPATVTNIIYDAIPRTASINLEGSPFSPATASKKSTLKVKLSVPNRNGMTDWKLSVLDKNGKCLKTFEGKENLENEIIYDGKDENGSIIPDGDYVFDFIVNYNNGQSPHHAMNFAVDTKSPEARISAASDILSPDGDGNKDTIVFSQVTSPEKEWNARIVNSEGQAVKTWKFLAGSVPDNLSWNGIEDSGNLAKDGSYYYELSCTDEAGNSTTVRTEKSFALDTSKTEVALHLEFAAFSPNGNGSQDSINFFPIVKGESGIAEYELLIKDEKGNLVKKFAEKAELKPNYEWNGISDDGSKCGNGLYSVQLFTESNNGVKASTAPQTFRIDLDAPEIAEFSGDNLIFSPNSDGKKDELTLTISTSEEDNWNLLIADEKGKKVRSVDWRGKASDFVWNGTDDQGSKLSDGNYSVTLSCVDEAGNSARANIEKVVIDTRPTKAYITVENEAFSPLAQGQNSRQVFEIMASPKDGIESWSVSILSPEGKSVMSWSEKDQADLPEKITWNGILADGSSVANGSYIAQMKIVYAKGDELSSATAAFLCAADKPKLKVQMRPKYFSPDNDGMDDDLFVLLKCESLLGIDSWSFEIKDPKGQTFWNTSGSNSITERLIWDGRSNSGELVQSATDYPFVFTVKDSIGLESKVEGIIPVDVLVIREGDVLKIQIPSIIFRSNAADFDVEQYDKNGNLIKRGITAEQKANNERVLKRIADILNKFKDYEVIVEGHANNISGTQEEEDNELIPLSQSRADYVKTRLTRYGVNGGRLSTIGKGGTQPVAATNDPSVNWKNRRVEFILKK